MKDYKFIFYVLILIGLFISFSPQFTYCDETYPIVYYIDHDKGLAQIKYVNPNNNNDTILLPFAGTNKFKIDNDTGIFYCVDFTHIIDFNPAEMIDTGHVKTHVLYIFLNYYPIKPYPYPNSLPDLNREAASIQIAIWHFTDSLHINNLLDPEIRARVLQIVADANANWQTATFIKTVKIEPVAISDSVNIDDTIRVKVTNTVGNPVTGVTVNLTTSAGTLSTNTAITGPDGYTPNIILNKEGPDSVAVIKACARARIGIGTIYVHKTSPNQYQKLAIASITWGNVCDRLIITWSTSGGGGGGIESTYKMAEMLFLRNVLLRKGEASSLVRNDKITSTYPLQTFIPGSGPYNSIPIETTPFDILSISNATSAYAVDYMLNNSRVAVIFSTTTNPPELYSHSKSVCDRLSYYSMEDLEITNIDGKPFYGSRLVKSKKGWTDAAISFTVFHTNSGFIIDEKWVTEEYQVPPGTLNVYNMQVWSANLYTTTQLVKQVIAKFQSVAPVTYASNNLKQPDIYIKKSNYTNDGKIRLTFKNDKNQYIPVNLNIYYSRQQGAPEQQMTMNTIVEPYGNEITIPIGYISDSRIYMTSNTGFMDAVFVGGGVYGPYAGPNSTITDFTYVIAPELPQYPEGSLVYPGGARLKGTLNDELMIGRSTDASFEGMDLSKFDKLAFQASGNGKIDLYLEIKIGGKYYYPYVQVNLEENKKLYEIPLRTFRIENASAPLNEVSMLGFTMKKYANPSIINADFTIENIAFYSGNDFAQSIIPNDYALYQNYPNPFNPVTFIRIDVPKETMVTIKLYDILGREVRTIFNQVMKPVTGYEIPFEATGLSTGVYFYRMTAGDISITKKMILQK